MLSARPVRGFFRRLRWGADAILIAILFAIPWIRIGGEPLILLDIPARKFHVFGLVIFPQELFFLWLLVFGAAIALFFFTALFGRLWCGWACPQTVFTDVFAAVARRIQGWKGHRPPARIALWRQVATHGVWIAMSIVIGFHLVGYFHSPYDLIEQAWLNGRVYPTALGFHGVTAALAYLDFAFVKQTFCKHLCPYARFQGVLFDRETLVVGYDSARGEPRGKRGRAEGDCVDCGLCVAVCPTEIDIREGLQLECIACTQCIDACNGVMGRLGRSADLIGYRTDTGPMASARLLRPRVAVYGGLLLAVSLSFGVLLLRRLPLDLQVAHNRSALAATLSDGRVGNAFTLHIQNRDLETRSFHIQLEDSEGFDLVTGVNPIPVDGASALEARVFVVAASGDSPSGSELHFVLERVDDTSQRVVRASRFLRVGPGSGR